MTTRVDAAWARRWITLAAADVASHRDYLIDLDRAIGDGDHGENMDRGFTAALAALESAEDAGVSDVLKTVAKTLMSTVGGAAGPLYGTAFLRASKAAASCGELDGAAAGGDASAVLEAAATAAQAGAQATEPLRATKGRASYLGERSIGHLDPGAVSTSLILRAAARATAGQESA